MKIGHFRAFALLFLKEATHRNGRPLYSDSTDNNGRLDAATPEQLATSPESGPFALEICGKAMGKESPFR